MYKLINIGAQANSQIREYIADTTDDIAMLPSGDPFGSTVFIINTSETYMKSSYGQYVKVDIGHSSGGGDITIDDALSDTSQNPVQNKVVKAAIDAGNVPFEVNAVITLNEQSKQVVTLNKTALECYNAAVSGRCLHIYTVFNGMDIDLVIPAEVFRAQANGQTVYIVKARADTTNDDRVFMSNFLPGDSIAVLTER